MQVPVVDWWMEGAVIGAYAIPNGHVSLQMLTILMPMVEAHQESLWEEWMVWTLDPKTGLNGREDMDQENGHLFQRSG